MWPEGKSDHIWHSYDISQHKSTKAALNACIKHEEVHLEMETFVTAIQEQAVTH
jgi:hypothetical protein